MIRPRKTARIALTGSLAAGLLVVTAQAAGASWIELNTPAVPGANTWEFNAVSCTSPHICMAVGLSEGSTGRLLSENRTRKGWTIQHVAQPAEGGVLLSVWCTFSFSCIAVGTAPTGASGNAPLAERWNGSSWHIQPIPKPPGAQVSQLNAVTCASALDCVAVGFASQSVNSEVPLVEHWNGTKWKIEKAPTRSGFAESQFLGVSCPAATRCYAVGSSFRSSPSFKLVSLGEVWNGSKWTIQATPNTASGGGLGAVACQFRTTCLAVGTGFGARWNGRKWSLVKLASPGDTASLSSISCTKAGNCYATGGFFPGGVLTGVIEFWNGSRWQVQNPNITASNDSSVFTGISCSSAENCTAVGSYDDPTFGSRTLAEDFSLRWQNVSPSPFFGVVATGLNAVSCASANACMAVGTLESTGGKFDSFSEAWDGSTWTSLSSPKPAQTNLAAVSCRTAKFCVAAGNIASGADLKPLAERWNGISWVIQRPPNPAGGIRSFLTGVSCPATNSCMAVGFFENAANKESVFAEHWNGTRWQLQHPPNPAMRQGASLASVSCGSARACEAVGSDLAGIFAESWNGTKWQIRSAPLPKGGTDGGLSSVSCASATACLAVGNYEHDGRESPLAEFWNGKGWKGRQPALPPGVKSSALDSVSCSSATACGAVGFKFANTINAFGERWNGKFWTIQPIDLPFGSQLTELFGVSCNSRTACIAVGDFDDSTVTEQMLAEQYS